MKLWQRTKGNDMGKVLISWKYKAPSRFLTKILTWLLGAFVFGIFTSITVHAIGLTTYALPAARIVFFITFVLGIIDAFFRNIVNGNEYQITARGLINSKPYCGFDGLAEKLKATGIGYFNKSEYIPWIRIKQVRETKEGVVFTVKDSGESLLEDIRAVISVKNYNEDGVAATKCSNIPQYAFYGKNDKFDREVKKAVAQKARLAIEGQEEMISPLVQKQK